jgi:hypothetical protein
MSAPADIRLSGLDFPNLRKALNPSFDIIMLCHNEFDLLRMLQFARNLEVIKPIWLKDFLPAQCMDSCTSANERNLKRAAEVTVPACPSR